ncbi:MAG: polysaccharide deacetylase family protein [Clostridiales bacterium]|nr:polysaccharide deacetylase family protein [Clostridiales bacterium]
MSPMPAAPKRTLTTQLNALRNTAAALFAVFMILLVAFVWMITSMKGKSSDEQESKDTTAPSTSNVASGSDANAQITPDASSEETTEATAEVVKTTYPEGAKLIALTFDDGPGAYTEQVLDYLKEYDAKATFYMVGQCVVDADPALLNRMLEQGCELGNHTYSHQVLTDVGYEDAYSQLERCDEQIMNKVGQKATSIRPPTGAGQNQKALFDYGIANNEYIVNWSCCPEDWLEKNKDPDYIATYVIEHAVDGDIVLLHDVHQTTMQSLPKMLQGLKDEGFIFVTVSELLQAREDGGQYGVRYASQNVTV